MKRTRTTLARILGWGALVLGPGLAGPCPSARADAEGEEHAQAMREKHPVLNLMRIERAAAEAGELTEDELVQAVGVTKNFLAKARKKWTAVQVRRRTNALVESTVVYKWAHDALAWAGTVKEKEDRLADIRRREDEEYQKRFGLPYHSIFVKKGKELEYEDQWYMSGRGGAYRAEEKAVHAWFHGEVKARLKEQSGTTPGSLLLDQMQAEAIQEITRLNRAEKTLSNALRRKRGEAVEETEAKERDAEEERHRSEMRLAPLRTEYEGKTGEAVETWFQVWKGALPYVAHATAGGSVEGAQIRDLPEGGDFVVPFTFRKPGTFTGKVRVFDAQAGDKSVEVTIVVTGEPVPDEKPPQKKPAGGDPGGAGAPGAAPEPIQGTFKAVLWGGTAELSRWDLLGWDQIQKTGAPMTLTIAPDGRLSSQVRYVMPPEEMKQPKGTQNEMKNIFWKTSFDLEGKVDWTSGKTTISIQNGHDERGYESDPPKTDDSGRKIGTIGHWRDWQKVDYSTVLEGWTLPGPQAAAWIGNLGKNPALAEQLKAMDLEVLGIPAVVVGAGNALSYRDRGFFGMQGLDQTPALDGVVPRRRTFRLFLEHMGYDGMNEKEENVTAKRQAKADAEAKERKGGWYLKVLGAAPADVSPPAPATEPKDDDVLAFGLWPVKPIRLAEGSTMSARAMGVFGRNVNDAVDLSDKATWTASPGLVLLKGGSFTAPAPGTYTLTATVSTPSGPMSSTIQVVVTKK